MTECLSIDSKVTPKRAYCRTKSQARTELEKAIVASHSPTTDLSAAIFPSGMSAISATFSSILGDRPDAQLWLSDEVYCDTPQCAAAWSKISGFKVLKFDVCDSAALLQMARNTKQVFTLLFLESCSNPSGKMLDWAIIPKLREINPQLVVCVDNTWLTPVLFNPFKFQVDIVIESMSKYRSKGCLIGGFVCCKTKYIQSFKNYITLHGMFIGADHCRIFLKAETLLECRILKASILAKNVIDHLQSLVVIVCPLIGNHCSTHIYSETVSSEFIPCVFLIHVPSNCSLNDMNNVVYPSGLVKETSYGAAYSKIDPWPHLGSSTDYDKEKTDGKQGVWLRVSVGYQDSFEHLLKNLKIVIETFAKL